MSNRVPQAPKTSRVRPGLYQTADPQGVVWTVEERQVDPGYGGGWAWFATSEQGDALDPFHTKGEAAAAVAVAV